MYNILKTRILPIIFSVSIILIVLITSINVWSFNDHYYQKIYDTNQTAQSMKMSKESLDDATQVLLDYLKDNRDNLDLVVEVDSQPVAMFNQKEIDHMVDVKKLYQGVLFIRSFSIITLVISAISLIVMLKRDSGFFVWRGFKLTITTFAILLAVLGVYIMTDFNGFWNQFHEVFFTNDLWILNPKTDRLINMVPLSFFNGLVNRIVVSIIVSLGVITGGLRLWKKRTSI